MSTSGQTRKAEQSPPNRLVTSSSNKDCQFIYEGSYDEVLGIANGLPGSSSVPACWLMRGHWKEIFPSLSEPSFKWVASGQEELCLTKIDKMLKSDNSKLASQASFLKTKRSEAEKKIEESSKRNPYLPLPPPPLMPHPDEIGENEKEEEQEENRKEANEKQDQKESKKQMVGQDFDGEEDYNEEEEFVDGNISDWLEY